MSAINKNILAISAAIIGFSAMPAHADDDNWKCEVVLCMANPQGATALKQCEPPWKKLMKHLADGHSFPHCDMGSGSNGSKNEATTRGTSVDHCPPQYIRSRENDNGVHYYCHYRKVTTIQVNGQPFVRVWWNSDADSVTEQMNTQAANAPGASTKFADDYAAWKIRKAAEDAKKERQRQRNE